jgi:putative endonuclease
LPPTTFVFYVYILISKKDNLSYIGCTNDLRRRFAEHNNGLSLATKDRRPFVLVYYEAYRSMSDARKRETRLKKFKNSYTELRKRIEGSLKC